MAANSAGASQTQSTEIARPAGAGGGSSETPSGGRPSGDDILGAVDGSEEPVFGVEEIAKLNERTVQKGKGQLKAKAKGNHGPGAQPTKAEGEVLRGDVARAQEAESIATNFSLDDFEQAVDSELNPASGTPGEEDAPTDLSDQASARFQELANRGKAAEARAEAAENAIGEMRQQYEAQNQNLAQYLHNMEKHNTRLQAQVEMLVRGGQQQRDLSPEEQIEQELVQKGVHESRRILDPQIRALTQRLDAAERATQAAQRNAEISTNKARYSAEADSAAREAVLAGFTDEEAKELGPTASRWVLSYAWANNTSSAEAAKMVRADIARFSLAFVRGQARQHQARREQAATLPKAPPAPRGAGTGEAEPTFKELRAAGYREANPYMQWELAGRPAITKKR